MKHNRRCRKLIAILLCICLMVPMISGCGEKKEEETKQTSSGTLVFQYGNNLVTKGEVYIYIETVRERYEMQYGSDVWQTVLPDGGAGTSMENLTREEVVNEIVRVKTLCAHAEELGITLGDDELAELNQKADDFCEGLTDEQLQNMEITKEKADTLRLADAIYREELEKAGENKKMNQYFAVLTDTRTVGVMGDGRSYDRVLALRAVTTEDFMTADWARIPYELLDKISGRIVNEVKGINRIVYDITSKPPATVEWE